MVLYINKKTANGLNCKWVLNKLGNSHFYVDVVGINRIFAVFFFPTCLGPERLTNWYWVWLSYPVIFSILGFQQAPHLGSENPYIIPGSVHRSPNTVDGSEIPRPTTVSMYKPCKSSDKLPTSTGYSRISEPSTIAPRIFIYTFTVKVNQM